MTCRLCGNAEAIHTWNLPEVNIPVCKDCYDSLLIIYNNPEEFDDPKKSIPKGSILYDMVIAQSVAKDMQSLNPDRPLVFKKGKL